MRIKTQTLIAHVGCGTVDEMGCCVLCNLIRARLSAGLPEAGELKGSDAVPTLPESENKELLAPDDPQ